jgi:uncharacterized protein (TIGR00297 family)
MNVQRLLLGLILGAFLGAASWRLRWLNGKGALAASIIGALTFGFGGVLPAALLILFFASSSLLSGLLSRRKRPFMNDVAKGGPRDAAQVFANGFLPAAFALVYGLTGLRLWLVGIVGSLAASTADTWGTELGMLAPCTPRLITTGQRVPVGTSGGVTLLGAAASLLGAGLIAGGVAWCQHDAAILASVWVGGLLGALIDSLLGATVQGMYYCSRCGRVTERSPQHTCGAQTTFERGWRWLDNDVVNLVAAGSGAIVAMMLWRLF